MLKLLPFLLVIGLMAYGWYRNDLRRLTRDFACIKPFNGQLQPCIVRFPTDETGTDCALGADNEGLHISSSLDALQHHSIWSRRRYRIKKPILIPWHSLEINDASFPMRNYLRFDVPSNGVSFFVPRDKGHLLLEQVGRATTSQG
jgi:hypothetical protein